MRLRHLAFFSALAEPSRAVSTDEVLAGLVVLRAVDHWFEIGSEAIGPDSIAGTAARELLTSIHIAEEMRAILRPVLNIVQSSPDPYVEDAVPRLFAYGSLLEWRGAFALAADVFETVIGFSNVEGADTQLPDALLRLANCRLRLAEFDMADIAFADASHAAARQADPVRRMCAKIGIATVTRWRGNLPRADEAFADIVRECETLGAPNILAGAIHEHAIVAQQRGDLDRAVCLADRARSITTSEDHRARLCGDLGAFFVAMGWFEAAQDALFLCERAAPSEILRTRARVNLLSVAARIGDAERIFRYRALLDGESMYPELRANYLIESARGARSLGDLPEARALLAESKSLAELHGLNRASFEADEMLKQLGQPIAPPAPRARLPLSAVEVVRSLRQSAQELISMSTSQT